MDDRFETDPDCLLKHNSVLTF